MKRDPITNSGDAVYIGVDTSSPVMPKRDTEALIANLVKIVRENNRILEEEGINSHRDDSYSNGRLRAA